MRFMIDWPHKQPPPFEVFNQLIAKGATLSTVPSAYDIALPDAPILSEPELNLFIEASMAEKPGPLEDAVRRIRKSINET